MPIAQSVARAAGPGGAPEAPRVKVLCSSATDRGDTLEIDFSIVIPAHNRPAQLRDCLDAIATLNFPRERFEVIVVDDGSAQDLAPAVVPFLTRLRITLLRQPNSGPAAARNTGAAAATGRYVVFTDDDCRPDSGWLAALAVKLEANPGCAAGGQTVNGLPENLFSTASQLLIGFLYQHWNRDGDDAFFIASNNLAFPRARFLELGGFDACFPLAAAEDRELCDRWRSQDGRLLYAPAALVHHFHALRLQTFVVQHFRYGCGARIFHERRRPREQRRAPVPPGLFYLPLMKFACTRDRSPRGLAVAMLVGLSQLVMPLGYLRQMFAAPAQTSASSACERTRAARSTHNARETA
jgi:GT2 family glycosyltransferase